MAASYDGIGFLDDGTWDWFRMPVVDEGEDLAFALAFDGSTGKLISVDISDEANPSVVDSYTGDDRFDNLSIDPANKRLVLNQSDSTGTAARPGFMLFSYDSAGNLTFEDNVDGFNQHGSNFINVQIIPSQQVAYGVRSSGASTLHAYNYQNDTWTEEGSIDLGGRAIDVGVDPTRELAIVQDSDNSELDVVDVSDPANMSVLHTETGYNRRFFEASVDSARGLFFIPDWQGSELAIIEWDGSSFTDHGAVGPDPSVNLGCAYDAANQIVHYGTGEQSIVALDVSDPANPTVDTEATSYDTDGHAVNGVEIGMVYAGSSRLVVTSDDASPQYFAVLSTSLTANDPPDQPTLQRPFDTTKYEVTLYADAYSDPDGDPHQDSRWQIQFIGTPWTDPLVYDSGWTASDLEQHHVAEGDWDSVPAQHYKARVRYRDDQGNASAWSADAVFSLDTTVLAAWSGATEMVRSFQVEPDDPGYGTSFQHRCYCYDQALAILAMLVHGDVDQAYAMAVDSIRAQYDQGHADFPGAWPFSWHHISADPPDPYIRSGAMGWMIYAFAKCLLADPDHADASQVETAMVNALDYLENNERYVNGIGLVSGGQGRYTGPDFTQWDGNYDPPWCATEHNTDLWFAYYAAYLATGTVKWRDVARTIRDGMLQYSWNPAWESFWRGVDQNGNDDGHGALDAHTWGSMVLRAWGETQKAATAMQRADDIYRLIDPVSDEDNEGYKPYDAAEGYPDAEDTLWLEGTFGATLGKIRIDEDADALQLLSDAYRIYQNPDGSFQYAAKRTDPYQITDQKSVASTSWAVFNSGGESLVWNEKDIPFEDVISKGFYFADGASLALANEGYQDDGVAVTGLLRPREISPAGIGGEALYRNLYLVIGTETEAEITVTPVVDGERVTEAQHTFQTSLAPGSHRYEIPLTRPYDRGGTTQVRRGLRGMWFTFELEAEDVLGTGGRAHLEGAEVEYEVVTERLPLTVFEQENLDAVTQVVRKPFYFAGPDGQLGEANAGQDDMGEPVTAVLRSQQILPAGAGGEVLLRNIYLALTRDNQSDLDIDVTPIIEGVAGVSSRHTLSSVNDPVTEAIEVPVAVGYSRGGTEQVKRGVRAEWVQVEVRTVGSLPQGSLILEGAELELERLQESEGAVSG